MVPVPGTPAPLFGRSDFGKAATLVVAYSLCSSTMLVVNKVAIRELPIPALVSGTQLAFSSSCVLVFHLLGWVHLARPRRRVLQVRVGHQAFLVHGCQICWARHVPLSLCSHAHIHSQPFTTYVAAFALGVYANIKVRSRSQLP
jgi:hypothetical protein